MYAKKSSRVGNWPCKLDIQIELNTRFFVVVSHYHSNLDRTCFSLVNLIFNLHINKRDSQTNSLDTHKTHDQKPRNDSNKKQQPAKPSNNFQKALQSANKQMLLISRNVATNKNCVTF